MWPKLYEWPRKKGPRRCVGFQCAPAHRRGALQSSPWWMKWRSTQVLGFLPKERQGILCAPRACSFKRDDSLNLLPAFGKSLWCRSRELQQTNPEFRRTPDLSFCVRQRNQFECPATPQILLKYYAESSFFDLCGDVSSQCFHKRFIRHCHLDVRKSALKFESSWAM